MGFIYGDVGRGSHLADKYRDTEIFVDEYKNQIQDFQDYVNVYVADLEQQGWSGQPIELLVNDAWKTVPIVRNTVSKFFPYLIPGSSRDSSGLFVDY